MAIPEFLARIRAKVGTDHLMLPGTSAIVLDDDGTSMLLIRRSDNGLWALPAGHIEPGEEPAQTLVREVLEETGLIVRPVEIAAVFGRLDVTFPNGDRSEYVTTSFHCEVIGGTMGVNDDEALEVAFKPLDGPEVAEAMARYSVTVADFTRPGATFVWDEAWLPES